MRSAKDIVGNTYGRLTTIEYIPGTRYVKAKYNCFCVCGSYILTTRTALETGHTVSCGCRSKECLAMRSTHGKSKTKIYATYKRMFDRCFNKNCPRYEYYGGRGITIDASWIGVDGFNNFMLDMGEPPSPKHSIDRIDNNGNYGPSNCKWSTQSEQLSNRRPYRRIK